ncbi:hypothetical protein R1sor_011083 [Riccia sorocarpa]|uniref:Uncharacterized protein n=1 Tax=Riccia sorocarpa TaxID=122646 RepID=A0ABD3HZV8_9MARC
MENVDAALGRLLRASSSVDSTQIVAQLKEVVTELRAMRYASESCDASLLEVKTSVASLTTMKTCLESILQMVSRAMEKLVETPLKNVQLLLNSIWLRLAAISTYGNNYPDRLESLKDAFKVDYIYQKSIWDDVEANPRNPRNAQQNRDQWGWVPDQVVLAEVR